MPVKTFGQSSFIPDLTTNLKISSSVVLSNGLGVSVFTLCCDSALVCLPGRLYCDVFGQLFDTKTGVLIGARFQVNQVYADDQKNARVFPLSNGDFRVVFASYADNVGKARLYSSNSLFAVPQGDEFVFGVIDLPFALAQLNNTAYSLCFPRFDASTGADQILCEDHSGASVTPATQANIYSLGNHARPVTVIFNNGSQALAYESAYQNPDSSWTAEIAVTCFGPDRRPISTELFLNGLLGDKSFPAIAKSSDGVVLVWLNAGNVKLQSLNSTCQISDAETQVNQVSGGVITAPFVNVFNDGRTAVTFVQGSALRTSIFSSTTFLTEFVVNMDGLTPLNPSVNIKDDCLVLQWESGFGFPVSQRLLCDLSLPIESVRDFNTTYSSPMVQSFEWPLSIDLKADNLLHPEHYGNISITFNSTGPTFNGNTSFVFAGPLSDLRKRLDSLMLTFAQLGSATVNISAYDGNQTRTAVVSFTYVAPSSERLPINLTGVLSKPFLDVSANGLRLISFFGLDDSGVGSFYQELSSAWLAVGGPFPVQPNYRYLDQAGRCFYANVTSITCLFVTPSPGEAGVFLKVKSGLGNAVTLYRSVCDSPLSPAFVKTSTGIAVAFIDCGHQVKSILLDPFGNVLKTVQTINVFGAGVQESVAITASPSGSFLSCWRSAGRSAQPIIACRSQDPAGIVFGNDELVYGDLLLNHTEPCVASDNFSSLVCFAVSGKMTCQFLALGEKVGPVFSVGSSLAGAEGACSLALTSARNFALTFHKLDSSSGFFNIWKVFITPSGNLLGSPVIENSVHSYDNKNPFIFSEGEGVSILWEGVGLNYKTNLLAPLPTPTPIATSTPVSTPTTAVTPTPTLVPSTPTATPVPSSITPVPSANITLIPTALPSASASVIPSATPVSTANVSLPSVSFFPPTPNTTAPAAINNGSSLTIVNSPAALNLTPLWVIVALLIAMGVAGLYFCVRKKPEEKDLGELEIGVEKACATPCLTRPKIQVLESPEPNFKMTFTENPGELGKLMFMPGVLGAYRIKVIPKNGHPFIIKFKGVEVQPVPEVVVVPTPAVGSFSLSNRGGVSLPPLMSIKPLPEVNAGTSPVSQATPSRRRELPRLPLGAEPEQSLFFSTGAGEGAAPPKPSRAALPARPLKNPKGLNQLEGPTLPATQGGFVVRGQADQSLRFN